MIRLRPPIVSVLAPALPLLCGALLLGACGGSDEEEPTPDAGDTSPDLGGDVDFETTPDVEPDIEPDVEPDIAPDVPPDVEPDILPDLPPDVPAPETACDDGEDNDGDGATDCEDSDCTAAPNCVVCDEDPFESEIALTRLVGNWEGRVLGYEESHTYTIPVCPEGVVRVTGSLAGGPVEVSLTSDSDLALPATPVPEGEIALELPYTGTTPLSATLTVTQPAGVCSTYSLDVAVDCGIVCGDDELEENDTRATATDFFEVAELGGQSGEGSGRPIEGGGIYSVQPRAADDDWYRVTLCPNGTGELWVDDYGNEGIDEGPPLYPVTVETALWDGTDARITPWALDGNAWGLNPLTGDEEIDMWLRVRPLGIAPDVQLCSSYELGASLDCECNPFGTAFLGKDESASGVRIPSGRVNNTIPAETGLFVCAGGRLRGTITSDDDVTLELSAEGLEGEFRFTDEVVFDPEYVEEGGYVGILITTTDACATYDLDLEVEGCACEFELPDTTSPDDAQLLTWRDSGEGTGDGADSSYGYLSSTLALSGGDIDYYELEDTGCENFDLSIYASYYGESLRTTRTFRVLDAAGVEIAAAGNRRYDHQLRIRASAMPAFTPPLFLEVTSTSQYLCDTSYFNIDYSCRELDCDDELDNDNDGAFDCDDYDCDAACFERLCDDGLDNDDDGTVDCEDEDCAEEFHCLPPGALLYESFDADRRFDLAGGVLTLTPGDVLPFYTFSVTSTETWLVEPGTSAEAEALPLTDDDRLVRTLPFSFEFFGEPYDAVSVVSNGLLAFGSAGNTFYSVAQDLLGGEPVIVVVGRDLNPAAGGTIWWDVAPTTVAATWLDVPSYGSSSLRHDAQVVLHEDGTIQMVWLRVDDSQLLVGVGAGDPGTPAGGPPQNFR